MSGFWLWPRFREDVISSGRIFDTIKVNSLLAGLYWEETTQIIVHQKNQWIHPGKAFIRYSSFEVPWSQWSWSRSPQRNAPHVFFIKRNPSERESKAVTAWRKARSYFTGEFVSEVSRQSWVPYNKVIIVVGNQEVDKLLAWLYKKVNS